VAEPCPGPGWKAGQRGACRLRLGISVAHPGLPRGRPGLGLVHHFAERFCRRWGHAISMDRFTETARLLVRLQQWSHVRKAEGFWQGFRSLHCVAIPFEFRAKSSRGFRTRMTRAQTAWVTWVEPVIVAGDTSAGRWCPTGFPASRADRIGSRRARAGSARLHRGPFAAGSGGGSVASLRRCGGVVATALSPRGRVVPMPPGALFRDGRSVNPGEGLRTSSQAARLEGVG